MNRTAWRRRAAYTAGLAVAWVMLWDTISVANVLGGLFVGTALLTVFPLRPVADGDRRTVHPLGFVRLAASVLRQLIVSNSLVAREVISPNAELRTGIVACQMRTSSPKLLSTVANILALSPGTMAVDAVDEPPTLFIHVLSLEDIVGVRAGVARLEQQVIEAFGSPSDRQQLSLSVADEVASSASDDPSGGVAQ